MSHLKIKENVPVYTIYSVKEFKELAKNPEIHEAYIQYTCEECNKVNVIHKAYGKGTQSSNTYYKMLKWEDDHPLVCPWCISKKNFRKTQATKGKEILSEESSKRWKTRKEGISKKEEEDSLVEYHSYEEFKKAFEENNIRGATLICPDCGKRKTIIGRQKLYHFMRNGDIRCHNCAISKGKKENNKDKIINDPHKLYNCHFKEGQDYKGADLEVRRELRNKYVFVCDTCNQEFEDSFATSSVIACPYCYPPTTTTSQFEMYVMEYIKSIYSGEILRNCRKLIPPKEVDIYLPEIKLAIEYDGLYWHSFKEPSYHIEKTLACEKEGVKIIHICSNDWFVKEKFVKEILYKSINKIPFDKNESIIYDRRYYSPLDFPEYKVIKITPPKHYFTNGNYLQEEENESFNKDYYDCGTFMIKKRIEGEDFPCFNYKKEKLLTDNNLIIEQYHPELFNYNEKGNYSIVSYFDEITGNKEEYKEIYNNPKIQSIEDIRDFIIANKAFPVLNFLNIETIISLIKKYLNEESSIFNPFVKFGEIMVASILCNKSFKGYCHSKDNLDKNINILELFNKRMNLQYKDFRRCKSKESSIFVCLNDIEKILTTNKNTDELIDYILENFKCKSYLVIVKNTEKYKNKVIENIINETPLGKEELKVILIKN